MRQFCYEVLRMRGKNRCVRSGDTALFWRERGVGGDWEEWRDRKLKLGCNV